ncbi:hypothetical protein FBU59_006651, partial [Linderina macrospora]
MAMPVQLNNILSDLKQLGDPLMVYLLPGSNQPITVTPHGESSSSTADNQQKSSDKQSSTEVTTSAAPPASSTYSQMSSSSAAPTSVSEETKPTSGNNDNSSSSSNGGIPDGQGNNFNTPSGAIRFPWNYSNGDNVVPITPQS